MNASNFEIQTPKLLFTVYDSDIKERNGKFFFDIPNTCISGFGNTRSVEIPAFILDRRNEILGEIEVSRDSIGSTETPQGKVYFFLTAEGKIKATMGEKTVITDTFYQVEGKKVLFLPGLGLDPELIEVPAGIETTMKKARKEKESKMLYLVYVGRSWLTGKDYYKFNIDISSNTLHRVKEHFEFFGEGEPEQLGELNGWLTSEPAKVEEKLRLRNTIENRKAEIDQQKEKIAKAQKMVLQNLTLINNGFKGAEYPDPKKENPFEAAKALPGYERINVTGEVIRNPFAPDKEWWILQKDSIWHVVYNGDEGDDWTRNNVFTENGKGAIGRRIEPAHNVAKLIKEIKNAY